MPVQPGESENEPTPGRVRGRGRGRPRGRGRGRGRGSGDGRGRRRVTLSPGSGDELAPADGGHSAAGSPGNDNNQDGHGQSSAMRPEKRLRPSPSPLLGGLVGPSKKRAYKKSLSQADATAPSDWGDRITGPRLDAMRPDGLPADWVEAKYGWCRPRMRDFQVVGKDFAVPYLPAATEPTKVILDFPKYPVEGEEPRPAEVPPLTARSIPNNKRRSFLINAAGSVWGLDFCPVVSMESSNYLAIGGYHGTHDEHHPLSEIRQSGGKGCIQLWEMGRGVSDSFLQPRVTAPEPPRLVMCLLHDFGCVWQMKWCPYGAADTAPRDGDEEAHLPKIGIMAASCGDGAIKLIVVPDPVALRARSGVPDNGEPLYVHLLQPFVSLSIEGAAVGSFSWGGSTRIAGGLSTGSIVVWDVESAIRHTVDQPDASEDEISDRAVVHFFVAHDSCIRSVDWNNHAEPTGISSVGMDGRAQAFDVRDPHMPADFYRVRGFLHSTCWPKHFPGICFTDSENTIRHMRVDCPRRTYGFMGMRGQIWDIAASNWHPFAACAAADGRVAIGNVHRTPKRYQKRIQATVFRLTWDKETRTYSFHNEDPLEEDAGACRQPDNLYTMLFSPEVQIQRTSWSNHPGSLSWVAGGGSAGLVRVDSTLED